MEQRDIIKVRVHDGIVGLLSICASPDVAFQSDWTFTSAPIAIPSNLLSL